MIQPRPEGSQGGAAQAPFWFQDTPPPPATVPGPTSMADGWLLQRTVSGHGGAVSIEQLNRPSRCGSI